VEVRGLLALLLVVLAGSAENFFVGKNPGDGGDGNGEDEKPDDLLGDGHCVFDARTAKRVWRMGAIKKRCTIKVRSAAGAPLRPR
jgi:hypothetical protein